MAQEMNLNLLVNSILNGMTESLTDEQLLKLKDILFINLHDVSITKNTYELALTTDNDAQKVKDFMISEKIMKRSDGTINQYVRSAWMLRSFIGKDFEDITPMDIKYFIAMKKSKNEWSDISVVNQCNNLRVFFSFLVDENYIEKNPLSNIKSIKCDRTPKKPFTAMELEAIRSVCYKDTRKMALIEFLDASGLRVASVVSLKWKDIDLFNRIGLVKMKGGDTDKFRFSEKSAFYLIKMMDERMRVENRSKEEMMERPVFVGKKRDKITKDFEALTTDGIRHLLKEIGKEAGIAEIYPHKFRRTFACEAINRGMPLEDLKDHMHHKQYDTTLKYAQLTSSRLDNSYRTYCE